jgi:hypothetical protein
MVCFVSVSLILEFFSVFLSGGKSRLYIDLPHPAMNLFALGYDTWTLLASPKIEINSIQNQETLQFMARYTAGFREGCRTSALGPVSQKLSGMAQTL